MSEGTDRRVSTAATWERFAPEGDKRCGEPKDACKCLLPEGHDGPHECPHGYWTRLVDNRVGIVKGAKP